MKKRTSLCFTFIISFIIIPISVFSCGKSYFSHGGIYKSNWNIVIPEEFELLFQNQNNHDFQGKGIRYALYEVEKGFSFPLNIKKNTKKIQTTLGNSQSGRNHDLEQNFHSIAADLYISDTYEPEFQYYYEWQKFSKNGSTLILLYIPGMNKVFLAEKLI